MNATERRKRFRAILAGDELVYAPHVWDPVSARVAEDLGFEVGVFSAHAAEWMVTGGIEMCRVTLTELAEQARRICRASSISVLRVALESCAFRQTFIASVMKFIAHLPHRKSGAG